MLGFKIVISFSPNCVLPNPCQILGFYLLIYIEHNKIIRFWFNGLNKAKEKIELWAYS